MSKYSVLPLPADILRQTAGRAKQLRKRAGYSQAELAERAAVSLGSLRRFEQTGKIAYESLLRIALILGKLGEFGDLFAEVEDMDRIERLFDKK